MNSKRSGRKSSKWTKRKLFPVTFKGREPRMLLWKKAVYEEWFHYAKLAQQNKRRIPRAFGNLKKFDNFEDWWRDPKYGFELFCEKPVGKLVDEVKGDESNLGANQILVKVDLTGDLDIIVDAFERYLKTKDVSDTYESNARFQPSRPMKNIAIGTQDTRSYKRDGKSENKLKTYRETYLLTHSMSYKEVALKLGWLEGDRDWYLTEYPNPDGTKGLLLFEYQKLLDNRVKKVKRHVDQVEKTFESIENGTFP